MAAADTQPDAAAGSPAPNETLYLNNLNERVPLAQLKAELLALCSEFGTVRDIVARKSLRKRGQAFVVYDSADAAARALPLLRGRDWHAKPIRADYARTRSDLHVPEEKVRVRKQKRQLKGTQRRAGTPGSTPSSTPAAANAVANAAASAQRVPQDRGEPHNVLFLEHIPGDITPALLSDAFKPLPGFREARMFAVKHLAFVEFESVDAAAAALDHWASEPTAPDLGKMVFAKK